MHMLVNSHMDMAMLKNVHCHIYNNFNVSKDSHLYNPAVVTTIPLFMLSFMMSLMFGITAMLTNMLEHTILYDCF